MNSFEKEPIGKLKMLNGVVCDIDVSGVEPDSRSVVTSRDIYDALYALSCDIKELIDNLN